MINTYLFALLIAFWLTGIIFYGYGLRLDKDKSYIATCLAVGFISIWLSTNILLSLFAFVFILDCCWHISNMKKELKK